MYTIRVKIEGIGWRYLATLTTYTRNVWKALLLDWDDAMTIGYQLTDSGFATIIEDLESPSSFWRSERGED